MAEAVLKLYKLMFKSILESIDLREDSPRASGSVWGVVSCPACPACRGPTIRIKVSPVPSGLNPTEAIRSGEQEVPSCPGSGSFL